MPIHWFSSFSYGPSPFLVRYFLWSLPKLLMLKSLSQSLIWGTIQTKTFLLEPSPVCIFLSPKAWKQKLHQHLLGACLFFFFLLFLLLLLSCHIPSLILRQFTLYASSLSSFICILVITQDPRKILVLSFTPNSIISLRAPPPPPLPWYGSPKSWFLDSFISGYLQLGFLSATALTTVIIISQNHSISKTLSSNFHS